MKNLSSIIAGFMLLLAFNHVQAATNVSGAITVNTTWNAAGSPYVVTSSITVNAGVTLTIQSGVTVQINDNFGIAVNGTLTATSAVFTSSSASPAAGKWTTFTIGNVTDSGIVSLTSCQLSYGQYVMITKGYLTTNATDFSNFSSYGIFINGSATNRAVANLTGGTFANCNNCIYLNQNGSVTTNGTNMTNSGVGVYSSTNSLSPSTITGGTISGMTTAAVYSNNPTLITLSGVTLNGNCVRGLYMNGATLALNGCTITGCTTPIEYQNPSTLTLTGTNTLTGNTNKYVYINHTTLTSSMTLPSISLPYYFPSGYTIYNTGRLQLSDDNILKFANTGINVYQGKLIANASVGHPIYFTSFKDDNLGGDANGDASATAPAINQWTGIDFPDLTIDSACILRRVTIKYADRGIEMISASPTIDSCTFSVNYHGIYASDASYPIINGCTFGSSGLTPIALTFDADPVFTGNIFSFQDNQYDAIGLIGSSIVANATLKIRSVTTAPNVTYVMLGDITIPVGKTLTINKGIVIKSPYQSYYKINVQGALFANGTVDSNIVMTSARDDNAGGPGDTNKDGTQTSPSKGDFGGIIFAPGSLNTSVVTYCDIRFASLYQTYYSNQYQQGGAITTVNVSPTISNCKITNCNIGIMCYQASNPVLTSNQITNSSSTPFAISVSANPTFTSNTFTNAGYLGLGIIGETVTASGIIKKRNISTYTNITYVLLDNLTIANGTNIEVESGVIIKFLDSRYITVNGGFKISGIPTSRVTFTTVRDDNVGNPFDTNGDGNATTPSAGNWGYLDFEASSDDVFSSIRCTDFKFAGAYGSCVIWKDAAASMDDCNLTNTSGYGLAFVGNSNPVVDSVQLSNGSSDPISMSLTTNPTFTNITFTANATKGIYISDVTLSSNALLKKRSMAGISNIAYYMDHLTIDANSTLSIEAGVVIKSSNYFSLYAITVNGAITALGTTSDRIVFTSKQDDSYGGDYNNNGNANSPNKNDWTGIQFNNSALTSTLKNCTFRYGGGSGISMLFFSNNTTSSLDSSIIEQSNTAAFGILGSASPVIKNIQIINIATVPVSMSMFSNPTFTNISLSNVATIGLGVIGETYSQNAAIPVRNFAGYTNISYIGLGTFTVNAGTTISIPAGIVYKGGNWVVNGKLTVNGTLASPVVFTCIPDDAYGNPFDTQQDGNLTDPKYNGNGSPYIQYEDISNDSGFVKNTVFRFNNGAGIRLNSASPTIDSCLFQTSQYGVYLSGVSQPVLNNSKFDNMFWGGSYSGYPICTSILTYPSSTLNNVISGNNTLKGIGIINETLSQDVTLVKRNFAGVTNIPYIFTNFTIGSGATLTIAPGVVCKFTSGQLYVNKGLIAEGGSTADSTIVFTSLKDDFYGGDTNADSNYTTGNVNGQEWSGIYIDNQAINTVCRFKNAIIKFATYGITTTSKSPSISNSLFRNNYEGIRMTGASNPVISNCDFVSNSNYGVENVDKSFTVNAQNCWWGDNSGPIHSTNPSGTGDRITDAVSYAPFRTIDAQNPVMGDVSLNGRVQAYDAALVLQKAVSLITFNAIQTRVGDVSGTAGITAFDASLILQYTVDKIRTFPAEELFFTGIPDAFASLTIDNKNIRAGDLFTIPVQISKVDKAQSFDLTLKFNSDLLELVSLNTGNFVQGLNLQQHIDEATGMILLSAASTELLASGGDVVWLTFKAKQNNSASVSTQLEIVQFLANETDLKNQVTGGIININSTSTGIQQLSRASLGKPFPNPFSESITIPYFVNNTSNLQISIYSILGAQVFSSQIAPSSSGVNQFIWDGKNNQHEHLEAGTYFIYMQTQDEQWIQKVTLIK